MPEYLLGHGDTEWARLQRQHALWRDTLLPHVRGRRVLEVGCGNGALLADLAARHDVVEGLERDPTAAEVARRVAPVRTGDLYTADLGGPWDAIVARWVFSFLPDVPGAVDRLAAHLAPGGRLVVQDYNHEGLSFFPEAPEVWRVIEAFRLAYARRGGDLWVAGRLPAVFEAAGLKQVEVHAAVQAGGPDSAVWRWVEDFLHGHVGTLVADGDLGSSERDAFLEGWARLRSAPGATLFSPIQVVVSGAREPS